MSNNTGFSKHTDEQKQAAVDRVKNGETRKAVAADLGIGLRTISRWCVKLDPDFVPTPSRVKSGDAPEVTCEDRDLSYRDCLRWAIAAAGNLRRTGEEPTVVPCNQAFFLFQQAMLEPKDFMAKIGQIESKEDAETSLERSIRKATKRSIEEIDTMLRQLGEDRDAKAQGTAKRLLDQAEADQEEDGEEC